MIENEEREKWVAWAAGIIEGEGYLGLGTYFDRRHKNGHRQVKPIIEVVNTEIEILQRLKELFGGWMSLNHKAGMDKRGIRCNKDVYEWGTTYRKALKVAEQIYPYLVGKRREQCLKILNHYGK